MSWIEQSDKTLALQDTDANFLRLPSPSTPFV